jgi:hypothetical protein
VIASGKITFVACETAALTASRGGKMESEPFAGNAEA